VGKLRRMAGWLFWKIIALLDKESRQVLFTPKGRVLRFGLGNAGVPSSAVWRMWVQGNETYLGVRTVLGVSKVSLHSSGNWALTARTGRVSINGPRSLDENWKVGPRIVFPGVPPLAPLGLFEKLPKEHVFLFQPPPAEHWRDFAILFSTPSANTDDVRKKLPPGSKLIGPLQLRDGSAVWLATFVSRMSPGEISYVRTQRNKFRMSVKHRNDSVRSAFALLIQDVDNGDTMLINLELGRENITVGLK
jgi:hypothetical protein